MTSSGSVARIPRVVTVCLTFAMLRHMWAAVTTIGTPGVVRPPDWIAMAASEALMLAVALHVPSMFYIRTLRLVGVATAAISLVVLAPLPDVIPIYDDVVPRLMLISLASGVAAMALSFLVMSRWAGRPPLQSQRPRNRNEWLLPAMIVLATLVILPLWFAEAGVPPLFSLLGGTSSDQLAVDRQQAFSRLGSAPLRLALGVLRNLFMMFAAGWFVASAATTPREHWRRRSTTEMAAMSIAGLGLFFALLTTERAVAGELLVVCGISFLVARRKELSAALVGALVAAAAMYPLAVGVLSGAGNLTEVVLGLRRRIFYLPTEVMTRYFIEFPRFHEHLGGTTVPKLSYLTGGETFDLSGYMYLRYYQRTPGLNGNANGSFFGVGWANFGLPGVVLWSLAAAVALVVLDRIIDRAPLRSGAALRGLGVIIAVLTTSSDIFRSVLGFAPGFLDLLLIVWLVARVTDRRTFNRTVPPPTPPSDDEKFLATSTSQSPD